MSGRFMTSRRVKLLAWLVAGASFTGAGCRQLRAPAAAQPAAFLDVQNNSAFEVNVYAWPSPASQTRVRLGTVTSFTSAVLRVPSGALRANGGLVVYVHAIGSRGSWTSPEVSVFPGVRACLSIYSDLGGDLSRSTLYTRVVDDTATAGAERCPRGE